ncbi:MAG: DNA helicase RecQ [Methanoregula sp.]|jgi:ATP-dependent DNA helicase RecQ|uniref:DNA helicase RecQ n=1 Tax=Methanoregula sp. TaxID=2052170 RepID=UPI003C28BD75
MDTPQTAPQHQCSEQHQTPVSLLRKYWGYPAFLPHQEAIIASVLAGNDTLAIMATGGGKSLCYQLPSLYLGGLTVVISPLIALMKDQVDDLNARGIPAAAFNSTLDSRERTRIEIEMKEGRLRLLFVSPEKCMQAGFLDTLASAPVRLIAIDEAHCISEWGHNFRPEYRELARFRKLFPSSPVIALTATAIPEVRRDICQQLGLAEVREFVGSFNRENLTYRVIPKKNPLIMLADFLCQHRNEAGIVYCMSKKETEEIAYELRKKGFNALAYHAGLPRPVRADVQDAFLKNAAQIVCATVAFGMGIDKPDVRFVIHYDLSKTVESYYQETGRAGRDGKPAECILFYSRGDYARVRSMLEHDEGGERPVRIALKKLQDMTGYCETTGCRRAFLLSYFGETPDAGNCGSCDTCAHPAAFIDGTEPARLIAACVQQLPSHFGIELITDVLRGKKSAKIEAYHFDRLPAYATGKQYSKEEYRVWINDLVRQGYLARTGDKYPVIALTAKSSGLLAGTSRVRLPAPVRETAPVPVSSAPEAGEVVDGDAREADVELFQRLKAVRTSLARESGVPPYVVFADRSLREMARIRPCDRAHFATIPGVGQIKQEKYGPVFLDAIRAFCSEPAD